MKVLLINPAFSYHTPWLQVTEPLGILYLASYLRKFSNHNVSILDCLDNNRVVKAGPNSYWYGLEDEEILCKIRAFKPDLIGITCLFSKKKNDFIKCARLIKNKFPEIILVGGGTYPSLFPKETLDTGLFDYCIIGEGEKSFLELLNILSGGTRSFDVIEGLAFKDKGANIITDKRTYIKDLDSIPFPARDMINYESYVTRKTVLHGLGLKRAASIITSRSCPNRCNFCSMFRIHGPTWRGRSARNVVDEIIELKKCYSIKEIFIMDDNFTFKRDRIIEICDDIKKARLKIEWNTPNGISINTLDRELLTRMKSSGCRSICIAIESGDAELRNEVIGKRLKDEKIEETVKNAASLGIFVTAFYIIGMPGETKEKFSKTLLQLKKLPLNGVAAAFANPMPGTKLYQDCVDNNWTMLNSEEEGDGVFYNPFIVTKDFSEQELLMREKIFYRTFLWHKFFTILKDTLTFKNRLLYPPFLMRLVKDRLFRK